MNSWISILYCSPGVSPELWWSGGKLPTGCSVHHNQLRLLLATVHSGCWFSFIHSEGGAGGWWSPKHHVLGHSRRRTRLLLQSNSFHEPLEAPDPEISCWPEDRRRRNLSPLFAAWFHISPSYNRWFWTSFEYLLSNRPEESRHQSWTKEVEVEGFLAGLHADRLTNHKWVAGPFGFFSLRWVVFSCSPSWPRSWVVPPGWMCEVVLLGSEELADCVSDPHLMISWMSSVPQMKVICWFWSWAAPPGSSWALIIISPSCLAERPPDQTLARWRLGRFEQQLLCYSVLAC